MKKIKTIASLLIVIVIFAVLAAAVFANGTTELPDGFEFDEADNILSGATLVNSSGYVNDNEKDVFLIDGIIDRKWCCTPDSLMRSSEYKTLSARGFCHFITFDFREPMYFNGYRLYHASNCAADLGETNYDTVAWTLEISNDYENWTVVHEMTDNYDSISDIYLGTRCARYVRLLISVANAQNDDIVRLPEMVIFGCDEGETVAAEVYGYNNAAALEADAVNFETASADDSAVIDSYVFEAGEITSDTNTTVTGAHIAGIAVCAALSLAIAAAACYNTLKKQR